MVEKEWERTGLTYEKLLKDCHPPPSLTKDDEFYMNCSLGAVFWSSFSMWD